MPHIFNIPATPERAAIVQGSIVRFECAPGVLADGHVTLVKPDAQSIYILPDDFQVAPGYYAPNVVTEVIGFREVGIRGTKAG